jgi:hypothetical protein
LGTWQAVLLFSGYFNNAQLHRFQIEESKYSGSPPFDPHKKVIIIIIMKSFVKLPMEIFVNWMVGEQLGGGGETPKKKGLDYYD